MALPQSVTQVNEHAKYYLEQEQKRDAVVKEKEEQRKKMFQDYTFEKSINKHFSVYKKDHMTEEDEQMGVSYRIDFTVQDVQCHIFSNESMIESKVKTIKERFSK